MTGRGIPYFDFYPADFMHGIRGLSAQEVGVYTMLLCRIYEEDGPVEYHPLRLSTYCGMRQATFEKCAQKLVALGKITQQDGMVSNRRAEMEISSRADKLKKNSTAGKASAQKRQQKQRKTPTDVQRTGNHTDTDTDTDKKEKKEVVAFSDPAPINPASQAIEIYNKAARDVGWPVVQKPTKPRISAINARLNECGGVPGWEHAIERARGSPLLTGDNNRGWRASFDWLTNQSNFTKLMEGNYDPATSSHHAGTSRPGSGMAEAFASVAAKRSGYTGAR